MASSRRNRNRPIRYAVGIDEQSEVVVLVYKRHVDYFTNGDWGKSPCVERWRAVNELAVFTRIWPEVLYEQLFG